MDDLTKRYADQLEEILKAYETDKARSQYGDLSDLGHQLAYQLRTRAKAAAERITGKESAYSRQIEDIAGKTREHDFTKLQMIMGVIESLFADLKQGYLISASQLIHGEVFADFLEMAEHLLNEGYKDAAAVICGGALEAHLKQLCSKHAVDSETQTPSGIQPKKADLLNSDLVKAGAYSKLDQKSVTSWLDLRNKAAHGQYSEYSKDQVSLLISSVRDFITRNPA